MRIITSLFFGAGLSLSLFTPQAASQEHVDLTKAKLLLEITKITVVSREVRSHSGSPSLQAACDPSKKDCEMSEEEVLERKFEEKWWEDERADEWYVKSEYHKYDGSEIWEFVGSTRAKEGSSGFVPRPKG